MRFGIMRSVSRRIGQGKMMWEKAGVAAKAKAAFNQRFWCEEKGYLMDVVDGERGTDLAGNVFR